MKPEEIEKRRKELFGKKLSKKEQIEDLELDLREFIDSCIVYRCESYVVENGKVQQKHFIFDKKLYTTIKGIVVISDERILEIFNEQKKTYENATIIENVYTDCEGLSYNSVIFN